MSFCASESPYQGSATWRLVASEAVADEKSCAGNAGANDGTLVRKADLIDAVNVSDGIAVAIQDHGGHGLVLLELLDLRGEFVNLLLQIAGGLL